MMQSRTHNCGELRAQHAGEHVKLVGWMENVREVGGSLAFVVLRDFYGTTQIVVETSELLAQIKGYNKESTISVEGTVRERASKNPNQPTGDIGSFPRRSSCSAAAATTPCRSRSTAAARRTRPSASSTAILTCAIPPSRRTSSCAATSSPRCARP